jgi:hypothetical protein
MERLKRPANPPPRAKLAESHYAQLARAYQWFNEKLFDGVLPPIEGTPDAKDSDVVLIFTAARKAKSQGYFSPNRWDQRGGDGKVVHEVNLNPDHFYGKHDDWICSVLVHEMTHAWQYVHSENEPNRNYHNREWAAKMEGLGLMPSNTNAPGGKRIGVSVGHYILKGGPFAKAFTQLADTGFKFELESKAYNVKERKPSSKNEFFCRHGHQKTWGKAKLDLLCAVCAIESTMKIEDKKSRDSRLNWLQSFRLLSKAELEAWEKRRGAPKAQEGQAQVSYRGISIDIEEMRNKAGLRYRYRFQLGGQGVMSSSYPSKDECLTAAKREIDSSASKAGSKPQAPQRQRLQRPKTQPAPGQQLRLKRKDAA